MKVFSATVMVVISILGMASCTIHQATSTQETMPATTVPSPMKSTLEKTDNVLINTTTPSDFPEDSDKFNTEPCMAIGEKEISVYSRPSREAVVFGSMSPGMNTIVEGRTVDGWLGFDPGVAQAANIGIFRLRWVEIHDGISLEGSCEELPLLISLPAGICFTMPLEAISVYAEPDISADVIVRMEVGDYAAVIGINDQDWARIDLAPGNLALDRQGWIQGNALNLNGDCDDLPIVE